jgi:zinc transporter
LGIKSDVIHQDSFSRSATYRFTWVATVFLPLSFLTGLLGINAAGIPGAHDPLAFWLVCSVFCVIAALWGL